MARDYSKNSRMAVGREICTLWYRAPELVRWSISISTISVLLSPLLILTIPRDLSLWYRAPELVQES